jgi:hypothetical protein
MSGRGNFLARVVQYVVNELIVDRLANKYENESSCFLFVYVSVSLSLSVSLCLIVGAFFDFVFSAEACSGMYMASV